MSPGAAALSDLPGRLVRRLAHERARRRLIRDVSQLASHAAEGTSIAGHGPRIGIATFGSGSWHLAIEVLLAHALRQRGARPELLVCDLPELPACDERTIHSRDRERCAGCIHDKRELLDHCGIPWQGLSGLVASGAVARAAAAVEALPATELTRYVERGWPVGQWLHVSASHYLRCDQRGDEDEKVATRRRFLASAIVITEAVERWLDTVKPGIVIAESGAHFMWRIAAELAAARGIRVVTREMGKGGWDRHIYAQGPDAMAPDLSEEWARVCQVPLSEAEEARVVEFLDDLPARTFVSRHAPERMNPVDLRSRLQVPEGKRLAVAFTNVTWDLATAGRDVAFAGVLDWVEATIRLATAHDGMHLIVRAHPAEASVDTRERILDEVTRRWPGGHRGLTLVQPEEPVAARDLIAAADLVLVYNSSVAIEAAALDQPVLMCGSAHYRNKGFTVDMTSREEYAAAIQTWADGRLVGPPHARALALRYAHLFFLRYHVPMGWTTSPLVPPYRLLVESLDQLRPGQNPALDVVCDGILNGDPILLPRPVEVLPCSP